MVRIDSKQNGRPSLAGTDIKSHEHVVFLHGAVNL